MVERKGLCNPVRGTTVCEFFVTVDFIIENEAAFCFKWSIWLELTHGFYKLVNRNSWIDFVLSCGARAHCVAAQHWAPGGPIFFYAGNEGPVDAYVANTGLMWEQPRGGKVPHAEGK